MRLLDDDEVVKPAGPPETKFTRIPYVNGLPFTSRMCEASGGHEVPLQVWPPRARHKHRAASTTGICKRCECNVTIYEQPGPVITVLLPDGRKVTGDGTVTKSAQASKEKP